MTAWSIAAAYLLSAVVGALITTSLMKLLVGRMNKQVPKEDSSDSTARLEWLSGLVGVIERVIVTTLVIWSPGFLGGFLAGWMALKVASGWGVLKEPTLRNRSIRTIALLGSAISIGWAIAVGLYFAPTESLKYLTKTS
jgi:hypothetical protein